MPQNPQAINVQNFGGTKSQLNISSGAIVKNSPGRVAVVTVIVAGSTVGTVNDTASLTGAGAPAAANQIATIPNTAGAVVTLNFPFATGLVVVPGTGQTVAVSFQ